MAFETELHYRS